MYSKFKSEAMDVSEKNVSCSEDVPSETDNNPDDNHEVETESWARIQEELRSAVLLYDDTDWGKDFSSLPSDKKAEVLHYVGGIDVSFFKEDKSKACAAFVVLNFPKLEVIYKDITLETLTAPYIPGFLAFREVDFFVQKINRLKAEQPNIMPQVVLVDGNGILHPKRLGLASHLGVLLNIPSVGVAKDLFQVDGLEKNEAFREKIAELKNGGDTFPLVTTEGELLGLALRSCDNTTHPVYVSVGHKVSLETAVDVTKLCCKYRVPEPTRQADIMSREIVRKTLGIK